MPSTLIIILIIRNKFVKLFEHHMKITYFLFLYYLHKFILYLQYYNNCYYICKYFKAKIGVVEIVYIEAVFFAILFILKRFMFVISHIFFKYVLDFYIYLCMNIEINTRYSNQITVWILFRRPTY